MSGSSEILSLPGSVIETPARQGALSGMPEEGALPLVSFVVPVLNDEEGLDRCLTSILANDYPRELIEIVVADNGSTDGSVAVARRHGAVVLHLPGCSVAEMRNRAVARASGDAIAFVDSDHEIVGRWLSAGVSWLRRGPIGGVGAACHSPRITWVQRMYDGLRSHPAAAQETSWLGTGNLLVWKRAFDEAGGFEVDLITCEDVDLCRKLRERGYRLVNDPAMRSVHFGDARTLHELFKGELWRGRDNLKVSLRERPGLRELPGIAFPPVFLLSLTLLAVSIPLASLVGVTVLLPLAAAPVALSGLRAGAILKRIGSVAPLQAVQAFAVALVYDVARALALVVTQGHRRARS